jgi:hypothetical protein
VIPSDLSFGYLSAELKSPVKIPIPDGCINDEIYQEGRKQEKRLGPISAKKQQEQSIL